MDSLNSFVESLSLGEILTEDTAESADTDVDATRNGLVLTVTSSGGGAGKTSVAFLLGATISQASEKAFHAGISERPLDVVVVDLDIFDGQLGFLMGQMFPTALDIALSENPFDPNTIKNYLTYNENSRIHGLLAPVKGRNGIYTTPKFYHQTIHTLKTMFDVVILDTSGDNLSEINKRVALPDADAILFVTTPDIRSIKGMARSISDAVTPAPEGGLGIDISNIGVVMNRSVRGVGVESNDVAIGALGAPLLSGIPLDTIAVQSASNANRLVEIIYHSTIGPAYFKLANKIMEHRGVKLLPLIDDKNNQ